MQGITEHHQTIPAHPGWSYCSPVFDGDTVCDIAESPVIAWIITFGVDDRSGEVRSRIADAVLADEVIGAQPHEYLKRPDGWYVAVEGGWYSRDELIEEMQREAMEHNTGGAHQ